MADNASDLVPVHGGLDAPVDRVVPLSQRAEFEKEAAALPAIRVTRADLSTVHRLADGGLSPLEGFMDAATWHKVLDEQRIERGGKPYAWTIPISLPVADAEASALSAGGGAALKDEAGNTVGILDGVECFDWDKAKYVKSVYRTERFDHPGGRQVEQDERTKLVGGQLRALPQATNPEYGEYMLSPRMTRTFIRDKKWEAALAFQTRNPLHRAHEYALVYGRRAADGPGPVHRRRAEPAGGRAEGRRRAGRDADALLPRSCTIRSSWAWATRTRLSGRGGATTSPRSSSSSGSTSRCSTAARRRR